MRRCARQMGVSIDMKISIIELSYSASFQPFAISPFGENTIRVDLARGAKSEAG